VLLKVVLLVLTSKHQQAKQPTQELGSA